MVPALVRLEETARPFAQALVAALLDLCYPAPSTSPPPLPDTTLLPSLYTVSAPPPATSLSPTLSSLELAPSLTAFRGRLTSFERMTAPDWTQDVRLLSFALPAGERGSWQPGGIAQIQPANADAAVARFFELQPQLDPAERVQFDRRKDVWEPPRGAPVAPNGVAHPDASDDNEDDDDDYYAHNPPPLPAFATAPLTAADLVKRHLDLSAIPTRAFFQWLRLFTSDEREIERLDEFLHPVDGPVRSTLPPDGTRPTTDHPPLSCCGEPGRHLHVRDPAPAVRARDAGRLPRRPPAA